ncbi:uncharacterized protein LOC128985419 isoform X2 [Macrosteles quadrilineatus]|uniref:uncharacterized protein LOC128985419 isoform X2 n=1 Tax=Macrosteles quadrilineatus TaxID=74068 RepID=UPI0023E257C5|nr:uncharacterized protein LOC128985419 isoform X2 [Macrosteles quadrilineatus]
MGSEPKRMRAIIKDPQHFKRVVETVQLFNDRQDLMDICFVCARGQRVYAHKLLLCSISTQMKEMFLEVPDNIDLITIHLPDIEGRILKHLFEFLYQGQLRLYRDEYNKFKDLMDLLGIVLHRSSSNKTTTHFVPETAVPTTQAQQPVQPIYYVQTPSLNNQGQMQYMLATQGQMMQMPSSAAPGQLMQVAQPQAQSQAPTTSMAQGQMMQMAPTIMTQVQAASTGVNNAVQQNNMVQMVPQNNTQVVPMVAGNQMVQCSSQMVVQGNQPTIINNQINNQMQGNIQNQQVTQPTARPQYVMSSSTNQMTTNRTRTQYTQPQITPQQRLAARTRTSTQLSVPTRNNTVNNAGKSLTEDLLEVFQENYSNTNLKSPSALTAKELRDILEPKLERDLTEEEGSIEEIIRSWREDPVEAPFNIRNKTPASKISNETPASNSSILSCTLTSNRTPALNISNETPALNISIETPPLSISIETPSSSITNGTPLSSNSIETPPLNKGNAKPASARKSKRGRKKKCNLSDDEDDEDYVPNKSNIMHKKSKKKY